MKAPHKQAHKGKRERGRIRERWTKKRAEMGLFRLDGRTRELKETERVAGVR